MLEKKARGENYQTAIQWLYDAGTINICYNFSDTTAPLEGNKPDNIFKIYMQDSGLFAAMPEPGTAGKILTGDLGMYKGAVFENIIADCFSKKDKKLYYYHKESGIEIDFVTSFAGETAIIEVKAVNGNAKSAKTVLNNRNKYDVGLCIRFSENNVGFGDGSLTVPYYMSFLI